MTSIKEQWKQFKRTRGGKLLRQQVYQRDNGRCVYCLKPVSLGIDATLDHVNPKANGGLLSDATNLVIACPLCNNRKGTLSVLDFCDMAGFAYSVVIRVNHQRHLPLPTIAD